MHTNFWTKLLIGVCGFFARSFLSLQHKRSLWAVERSKITIFFPMCMATVQRGCAATEKNCNYSLWVAWTVVRQSLDSQHIFHRLCYFIFERSSLCFSWSLQFISHHISKCTSYFPVYCLHSQHWGEKFHPNLTFVFIFPWTTWTLPCEVAGISVCEGAMQPDPCKPSIIS